MPVGRGEGCDQQIFKEEGEIYKMNEKLFNHRRGLK